MFSPRTGEFGASRSLIKSKPELTALQCRRLIRCSSSTIAATTAFTVGIGPKTMPDMGFIVPPQIGEHPVMGTVPGRRGRFRPQETPDGSILAH